MNNKTPWVFCETPEEKCTLNHCDENGCMNRKKELVNPELSDFDDSKNLNHTCPYCGIRHLLINDHYSHLEWCDKK